MKCQRCGRLRTQQHYAIHYPFRKGRFYYVKVSSWCKPCRHTKAAVFARRVWASYSRSDEAMAFQWAGRWCKMEGGWNKLAERCYKFVRDPTVSSTEVGKALMGLLRTLLHMSIRADELKVIREQSEPSYFDTLSHEQKQEYVIKHAKKILRRLGYILKRRWRDHRTGSCEYRAEREKARGLKGQPLFTATVTHSDQRLYGPEPALEIMLRKLRELYLQATERQGGRNVRFHVGLSIEENRESLEFLERISRQADDASTSGQADTGLRPQAAPATVHSGSDDRLDTTPSAG